MVLTTLQAKLSSVLVAVLPDERQKLLEVLDDQSRRLLFFFEPQSSKQKPNAGSLLTNYGENRAFPVGRAFVILSLCFVSHSCLCFALLQYLRLRLAFVAFSPGCLADCNALDPSLIACLMDR